MSILKKLERLTGRDDWEETNGPEPLLDHTIWFVNGNYEIASVDQEDQQITIRDSDETIIFEGNLA